MEKKYYRDLESEKRLGELVSSEELFDTYVDFCKEGALEPEETSFSDFLTNADERWGGTLREVNLDNPSERFLLINEHQKFFSRTHLVLFHIPDCFEDEEVVSAVEDMLAETNALCVALQAVSTMLHGSYEFVKTHGPIEWKVKTHD